MTMEEELDDEIIYYGIPLAYNMVEMIMQAYLYKVLFFHPRISAKKAHELLSKNYRLLTHRKHALRWRKQIKPIVEECDTTEKVLELIQQVGIKVVKWGRQFSWPIAGDLMELCEYLDISYDILITVMYNYFIKGPLTKEDINGFLGYYEVYLLDGEVDELLGQLSHLKQLAAMDHQPKPGHLTAKRLFRSIMHRG
jgi:hypothetical protein